MSSVAVPKRRLHEFARADDAQLVAVPASDEHSHVVRLYDDDDSLCTTVAQFLGGGLAAGEPLVVVATPEHRDAICRHLEGHAFDVARARVRGRILLLDARETLAQFMMNGAPDPQRFADAVGGALARIAPTGPGRVRAYGEMVDLLWRDGERRAAIRLEELWNDLAKVHSFSLLCAYVMGNFYKETDGPEFREMLCQHTHVLPTESYAALETDAAKLREIAVLQQRARALEAELEARKIAEQREAAARHEAERANRLKDEFLATLSHELRTPLNAILGWATTLRLGGIDAEKERRAIATIERNALQQAQLIEDLLDVSRIIAGKLDLKLRSVDLGAIVGAAVETVRPAAEAKEIGLTIDREPLGLVAGDAARLQQIVTNLVSNAVKFTPSCGRVSVALDRVEAGARIRVTDTGRGIEADFLPHVFERFRQHDASAARTNGGLGLGLAIVQHLVLLHGGTITAESDGLGKGARFTVVLPISAAVADEEPRTPERARTPTSVLQGVRVLVVEDQEDGRELLQILLEQEGATVRAAASAAEAITILAAWIPDVLVSDIGLPGADGYDLIRQVRALPVERGGLVPAVALTAFANVDDTRRALASGYQMHVSKPTNRDRLIAVVDQLARLGA